MDRASVATVAARLPALEERRPRLLAAAERRNLEADPRRVARSAPKGGGPETPLAGGDPRQPVGGDRRRGREFRGYDAGKTITGRKRHLAVDTLGLAWMAVVQGAELPDHGGAAFVIARLQTACTRLKGIFADSAYGRAGWPEWVQKTFGWTLRTVLRPVRAAGFVGAAEAVDRGADVRLAQPLPTPQQRLRTESGHQRSLHPHRDDQPDVTTPDAAIDTLKRRSECSAAAQVGDRPMRRSKLRTHTFRLAERLLCFPRGGIL